MGRQRWVAVTLGTAAVVGLGAVSGRLAPVTASGTALSNEGIIFADGTVQITAAGGGDTRIRYYLDAGPGDTGFDGAAATTACDTGFHFATVFEILDPSNLSYDTTRGVTTVDSGLGPPQTSQGWIRTGDVASSQAVAGFANCGVTDGAPWVSNAAGDSGTYLWLEDPLRTDWNTAGSRIAPWSAGVAPCNITFAVWCVEDSPGAGG